jgi:hypothetical protein
MGYLAWLVPLGFRKIENNGGVGLNQRARKKGHGRQINTDNTDQERRNGKESMDPADRKADLNP